MLVKIITSPCAHIGLCKDYEATRALFLLRFSGRVSFVQEYYKKQLRSGILICVVSEVLPDRFQSAYIYGKPTPDFFTHLQHWAEVICR
jgi:hypothetical protein